MKFIAPENFFCSICNMNIISPYTSNKCPNCGSNLKQIKYEIIEDETNMAVIITDMNMPHCCAMCEFGKRFDNSSCLCEHKPAMPLIPDFAKRPNWCPLVEYEDLTDVYERRCKNE